MNYKERIETLREKGIFTEEQARRLEASFAASDRPPTGRGRGWLLEVAGLLLVAAVIAGFALGAVGAMEAPAAPQSVAESLNAPASSGIGAGSAAWMAIGMIAVGLYLIFYTLVRGAYRRLWNLWLDRRRVLAERRGLLAMREDLYKRLEEIRNRPSKGARESEGLLIDIADEARSFVMETLKQISGEEQALLSRAEELKARCKKLRKSLAGALAPLAGPLPKEEE